MRIRILGVLVSLMVLSACVPAAPEPTQTFTPIPTTTDTPTPQPTATLLPTVTAEPTATEQFFFPEPVGEPAAAWEGIPIMPEATAGEGYEENYLYSVMVANEDVEDFYQRVLPGMGWEPFAAGKSEIGESVMLIYKKGTDMLTIAILPTSEEGKVQVMLIK